MESWMTGAIVGGIAGGLAGLVLALAAPRRKCPDCGELLPRFRKPANRQQALSGGTACPKCGCVVDRRGRKVQNP